MDDVIIEVTPFGRRYVEIHPDGSFTDITAKVEEAGNKQYPCKICGEMILPREVLEHGLVKHDMKECGELMEKLNKLGDTGR